MSSEQINYKVEDTEGNVVFKGSLLEESLRYFVEDFNLSQMYTVYKLVDSTDGDDIYQLYTGVNTNTAN